MKKIKFAILCLTMSIILGVQPSCSSFFAAEKPTSIVVDGMLQKIEPAPKNIMGTVMMEAKTLYGLLGLTQYNINLKEGYTWFKTYGMTVYFEVGNKYARVNNLTNLLSATPEFVEDKYIYIPLRYVAQICNVIPVWYADFNSITLDTSVKDYSVIDAIKKNIDYSDYLKFTLSSAVLKVYNASNDVVKLDKVIEDSKEKYDDLLPDYNALKRNPQYDRYSLTDMERTMRKLDDAITIAKINKDLFKKSTEASILSYANTIETSEYDIMLLEKKIALSESNIKNMELKQSVGYETETNIKTAKDTLAQDKINLKNLKINLENSKMDLNKAIKVAADAKVRLDLELKQDALDIPDLDKYIEKKVEKNLNVQLKDIDFRYAWLVKDTHYQLNESIRQRKDQPGYTEEKDSDVDQSYKNALSDLDKEKEDLDYKIRKAYNNLKLLDEQYKLKEIDRQKAIDSYKTLLVLYLTGNATIYELQQTELSILSAEIATRQNRLSYRLARYQFDNTEFLK